MLSGGFQEAFKEKIKTKISSSKCRTYSFILTKSYRTKIISLFFTTHSILGYFDSKKSTNDSLLQICIVKYTSLSKRIVILNTILPL